MQTLSKWNYAASGLHATAALVTYLVLNKKEKRMVDTVRGKFDENAPPSESRVNIPVTFEYNSSVDLKGIVVGFFLITSIAHLLYATDFFGKGYYSSQILGFGWNPFRWIEYSLSAGIMIYLISIVSGTKDQISAISAALITPGLMLNGFTNERALRQNELSAWSKHPTTRKPMVDKEILFSNLGPAWFLFGVKWYIILSNYAKISKEAKEAGKPLDGSVTFLVYSQLFFFSIFGVIQTFQAFRFFTLRAGRIEPMYITYEKAYIILSAVTKLFLAATVAYALRN